MGAQTLSPPWGDWVPLFMHPIKVFIIEAFVWIEEPLSARTVELLIGDGTNVANLSYHMRTLAEHGILENAYEVSVRGALQKFYSLRAAG